MRSARRSSCADRTRLLPGATSGRARRRRGSWSTRSASGPAERPASVADVGAARPGARREPAADADPCFQPGDGGIVNLPTIFAAGEPRVRRDRAVRRPRLHRRRSLPPRGGSGRSSAGSTRDVHRARRRLSRRLGQPHLQPAPGERAVSVTTYWSAEFTVDGQGPFAVPGPGDQQDRRADRRSRCARPGRSSSAADRRPADRRVARPAGRRAGGRPRVRWRACRARRCRRSAPGCRRPAPRTRPRRGTSRGRRRRGSGSGARCPATGPAGRATPGACRPRRAATPRRSPLASGQARHVELAAPAVARPAPPRRRRRRCRRPATASSVDATTGSRRRHGHASPAAVTTEPTSEADARPAAAAASSDRPAPPAPCAEATASATGVGRRRPSAAVRDRARPRRRPTPAAAGRAGSPSRLTARAVVTTARSWSSSLWQWAQPARCARRTSVEGSRRARAGPGRRDHVLSAAPSTSNRVRRRPSDRRMWLFTVPSGHAQQARDLGVGQVVVERQSSRCAGPARRAGTARRRAAPGRSPRRRATARGRRSAPASRRRSRLRSRSRAAHRSATLLRVMPSSHPGRLPAAGLKPPRPRQAATNTCCVTSSASSRSPRVRSATAKTSGDHRVYAAASPASPPERNAVLQVVVALLGHPAHARATGAPACAGHGGRSLGRLGRPRP